jgi:Trk K+ transport system NAD-binding subunit
MVEGFTKNTTDLSLVDIKNEQYDRKSCFVGTGISGYQIAKRLSEEYFYIGPGDFSRTVLNVIHQSGESSKLIDRTLWHLQNQGLVIISGSTDDPFFLSLRNMALSNGPLFLWTILDSQKNIIEHTASIQPQMNESITIIPLGTDYIKQSFVGDKKD